MGPSVRMQVQPKGLHCLTPKIRRFKQVDMALGNGISTIRVNETKGNRCRTNHGVELSSVDGLFLAWIGAHANMAGAFHGMQDSAGVCGCCHLVLDSNCTFRMHFGPNGPFVFHTGMRLDAPGISLIKSIRSLSQNVDKTEQVALRDTSGK